MDSNPLVENMTKDFLSYRQLLTDDGIARRKIKAIKADMEGLGGQLKQCMHSKLFEYKEKGYVVNFDELQPKFDEFAALMKSLLELSPKSINYRDVYKVQASTFVAAILVRHYFEHEEPSEWLAPPSQVWKSLHLEPDQMKDIFTDEDYLFAVLKTASTLSRHAKVMATCDNYQNVERILHFLTWTNKNFSTLCLRNGALRRAFDRLKYEVESVESVVFTLKTKGLLKEPVA